MSHLSHADLIAHRVEGTPLPCACASCTERARGWEEQRAAVGTRADSLPASFWTAQAARLGERAERPSPIRPRALAAAAAVLVLGTGLALLLGRGPAAPTPVDDFEARYAAVLEAMERSPIGDLEACGVLINDTDEGGDAAEEAL